MPPRVALRTRGYLQTYQEAYVCPTCAFRAANSASIFRRLCSPAQWPQQPGRPLNARRTLDNLGLGSTRLDQRISITPKPKRGTRRVSNGGLVSSTAINAPTSVPHKYRELHQSLSALQGAAGSFVDRSRLQLALRSLESEHPVIRVALLGLGKNGPSAARRLARVLLSDALGEEEAWERELLAGMEDGWSLLLRYGDPDEAVQSNALVRTMNVPSRYLQRHNLEILITPLNASENGSPPDIAALEDAVLVPSLTTPNASDGRVGFIRYPVHKSVIVAGGVMGAIEYGKFPSSLEDRALIKAAVNVSLKQPSALAEKESENPSIDIELATHALELFRLNKANGAQFSDEWHASRLPSLSEWIAGSKPSSAAAMNQGTANLILSVIARASMAVTRVDELGLTLAVANTVPERKRAELVSSIAEWSADSHRDLQENLDTVLATSASWRRTVWWRLFWRIDDVAVSASDVLRQSWLTQAEQSLAFLSGRILEAGVASVEELQQPKMSQVPDEERRRPGELTQMPSHFSVMQQQTGKPTAFDFAWPPTITLSRVHMLNTLVPELHRKAQTLLLSTLSTITGSAALATWLYFATAGVALYEAGAILLLGLVWSFKRLQNRWEAERVEFATATREDARRVLGDVENHLRRLVHEGARITVDPEDVRSWQEARQAIEHCRQGFEKAALYSTSQGG